MDEATIIGVLRKWNPWERKMDSGIPRGRYVDKIYPYFDRKEVLVLKGIRRSGKSTIVKQLIEKLIEKGVNKKQILYLNLEDYNFANDLEIKLFEDVLDAYRKYTGNRKRVYFFIDEVQKVKGWEKWVRTKYDLKENIKFVITGSSTSLLSKELSTLLTGRNISFRITPLSFNEFLDFSKTKSFEEYLQFGGFPEIVLENNKEKKNLLLSQYFEDIIHKDIIDRYNIRNAKQLKEIARYLVSTAGSKVSLNKLSKVFGLSKDTISMYISYMVDAYLLQEVPYFSYSAKIRHDVAKLPKFYVTDNGMIDVVSIKYSENRGQMFENTVLIKLLEKFEDISYWSELKSEVDFIVDRMAMNVTATNRLHEREKRGLEDFIKKHKNFSTLIITESFTRKKENMISLITFLEMAFSKTVKADTGMSEDEIDKLFMSD